MFGQDGISGIQEMKTSGTNTLPAKVFVGGIKILRIDCKVDDVVELLYRNAKANSPFQPAFFNCICDESEDAALRLVFLKTEPSVQRIKNNTMLVSGIRFNFEVLRKDF